MEDIRNGTCPLCHARGILEIHVSVSLDGFVPRHYACRACGFLQSFLPDVAAYERTKGSRYVVIGGDENEPYR